MKLNNDTKVDFGSVQPLLQQTSCCTLPFVQLWNEDCLKTLKRLPDASVDLILQDTPYGTTQLEWDKAPNFEVMWKEWLRVAKENAAIIFTASQPFTTDLIISNRKLFRYEIIWKKTQVNGFLDANRKPLKC